MRRGGGSGRQAQTGGGTTEEAPAPAPVQQESEPVELDPLRIDNPYWPMAPGSMWVYRETGAEGNEQQVDVAGGGGREELLRFETP